MLKNFEDLLKSEIKKVEAFAQKRDNKDSRVTGWFTKSIIPNELGFVEVKCEICSNSLKDREDDVTIWVYMPDRRRSYVSKY